MKLKLINYTELNNRQKERYNFQKIAGLLADYGYACIKLDDDWQGADFLAQHIKGSTLKVQLKGRLTFSKKYQGKKIYIAFPHKNNWYLFNHDKVLQLFIDEKSNKFSRSVSWTKGTYSWNKLSKPILSKLKSYKIEDTNNKALHF